MTRDSIIIMLVLVCLILGYLVGYAVASGSIWAVPNHVSVLLIAVSILAICACRVARMV